MTTKNKNSFFKNATALYTDAATILSRLENAEWVAKSDLLHRSDGKEIRLMLERLLTAGHVERSYTCQDAARPGVQTWYKLVNFPAPTVA